MTPDQTIRAAAVTAAATWLAGDTWTHAERRELLTVASAIAGWIRDGEAVDPQPRPRRAAPNTEDEQ